MPSCCACSPTAAASSAAIPNGTSTSSISRSRTSIIRAPRLRARRPTASANASTRLRSTSSIEWRSARRCTIRSTSCRQTLTFGCASTMKRDRIGHRTRSLNRQPLSDRVSANTVEADLSLVFLIELVADGCKLTALELGDLDGSPTLGGAGERTKHQLEDRPLAEGIRDDLEAAALLNEQTLEQIRGPDRPAMGHWEAQVRDAGFEVVHEAHNRALVLLAVVGHDAGCKLAGNRPARRLVGRLGPHLELRPYILRQLGSQVAHAMRQAALAGGARKAHLDGLDDAGRTVRGYQ